MQYAIKLFFIVFLLIPTLAFMSFAYGQVPLQNEDQKLLAFDGARGDYYGFAIDADEQSLVITSNGFEYLGSQNAAAYVYKRAEDGTWILEQKLTVAGAGVHENFGSSVAIDGDTIAIGAPSANGPFADEGAVFVFSRDSAGSWALQARLRADDATLRHGLGVWVDIDGETLAAGAFNYSGGDRLGSAYIFTRDSSGLWSQQAKLLPADVANYDYFGTRLALQGDTLFVRSAGDDDTGPGTGSVYLYQRNISGQWIQWDKLYSPAGSAVVGFGGGLAIDGDTAMISGAESSGSDEIGVVYVYENDATGWVHQTTIRAPDPTLGRYFGGRPTIRGDRLVVSAPGESSIYVNEGSVGAAYVFQRDGSGWRNTAKLIASDGRIGDRMGTAIGISGDSVILGAYFDDDIDQDSGSAYVFEVPSDDQGPVTTAISMWPDPVVANEPFDIAATISDTGFGDSIVASAEYSVAGYAGAMTAADGVFDTAAEEVVANIPDGLPAGLYDVCVVGTDVRDNIGPTTCVELPILAFPVANAGFDLRVPIMIERTLDGSNSYDLDGDIVSYEWDFDDGTTGNGETTAHAWMVVGLYSVTLTVTDDDGLQSESVISVEVITAIEAIDDLLAAVTQYFDDGLFGDRDYNRMVRDINQGKDKVKDKKWVAARRKMFDFIEDVDKLLEDGVLGESQAKALTDPAYEVIMVIETNMSP